jgi:predicted GIY-YIG superfamily endonuclease
MPGCWVYTMTNPSGGLYAGLTSNRARRACEHRKSSYTNSLSVTAKELHAFVRIRLKDSSQPTGFNDLEINRA